VSELIQWSLVGALWICVILLINEHRRNKKLTQAMKEIQVEIQWQIMIIERFLDIKRVDNE